MSKRKRRKIKLVGTLVLESPSGEIVELDLITEKVKKKRR